MDRVAALMWELGLGEPLSVVPLTGGVSSDIALVETTKGRFCVKFALARLKVAADWQVPVGRNAAEYDWLDYVARIDPALVPHLSGKSEALGGFAMAYLPPKNYPNWKAEMLAGRVDVAFAAKVGDALGCIHSVAARDSTIAPRFANQANFHAIRLDPYLATTAERHPALAARFGALIDIVHGARITLVHGDVSPKNILMGPDGPVFLDAECAVCSDPAFDLAFCLNHLVIKAVTGIADPVKLTDSARALWDAYVRHIGWEPVYVLESRIARLLPALALARVDGKSPVEYLNQPKQSLLRHFALTALTADSTQLYPIFDAAFRAGKTT